MRKSFAERVSEDRRLVILRLLEKSQGYTANESLIQIALRDLGHVVTHDQVRSDLAWLKENGLAELEEIAELTIARATQRGLEAAQGIIATPGVKRPAPRA